MKAQLRETRNLEFKRQITDTFLKTVVAFANYEDGQVLFGIDDDGVSVGLENPIDDALTIENKINSTITPRPEFSIKIDKNSTIILSVKKGQDQPYMYKGKSYVRFDSSTVEVTRLEFQRLVLAGANRSYEELESLEQELEFTALEKQLQDSLKISGLTEDVLRALELLKADATFNNAAAILADRNQFPGVDISRFGFNNELLERIDLSGKSLLKQFEKAVQVYAKNYVSKSEQVATKSLERVPQQAFREALANALAHRTWDTGSNVHIGMYPERIEIVSPGGLPAGLTSDDYLNGQLSLLRNPILAGVLFRLGYIEKFGTGIARINDSYRKSLVKPSFSIHSGSIKVVLPEVTDISEFSERERQILLVMHAEFEYSRLQIEHLSGLGKGSSLKVLNALIAKGVIEKSGSGKNVRYRLAG